MTATKKVKLLAKLALGITLMTGGIANAATVSSITALQSAVSHGTIDPDNNDAATGGTVTSSCTFVSQGSLKQLGSCTDGSFRVNYAKNSGSCASNNSRCKYKVVLTSASANLTSGGNTIPVTLTLGNPSVGTVFTNSGNSKVIDFRTTPTSTSATFAVTAQAGAISGTQAQGTYTVTYTFKACTCTGTNPNYCPADASCN